MQTVHATAVCFAGIGLLLRGEPGSGKSSLALQLIEQPGTGLWAETQTALLVSDDQTVLTVRDGVLMAAPPPNLAGLLEVRGLGILNVPHAPEARIHLVADLMPARLIARLPEADALRTSILGVELAAMALDGGHPSAASRLRLAALALTRTARVG